jgi:ATP phosphoribosyltransferase regulatory subunit
MTKKEFIPQIPYGTKDILPEEAGRKRCIENQLAALFSTWGFSEVITPAFEYFETLKAGAPGDAEDSVFRFFDRGGRMLALRPDMTTPIARVAAMRMKESPLPLRLFYLANVFRHEQAQAGRQCEFYQAGVELLGADGAMADAEVVALAVEAMQKAGLKEFQVGLGQVDFISGIMEAAEIRGAEASLIKKALVARDMVSLGETMDEIGVGTASRKLLEQLPLLHGQEKLLRDVRRQVGDKKSQTALDNLAEIYELLRGYGVEKFVTFDLGIIRDFEYYTGMVFEAYTAGLGYPICGGGRYDRMTSAFGADYPATGFALGIERVILALERQNACPEENEEVVLVSWAEGFRQQAIKEALSLRAKGTNAALTTMPQSKVQAERECRERGCSKLVFVGDQ